MFGDHPPIGVVGSPSSCGQVTINLSLGAYRIPLLGRTVAVHVEYADAAAEVALGTVTSVSTVNDAHRPGSVLGMRIAATGTVPESGDQGDIRSIQVRVDAVFAQASGGRWVGSGVMLSNSPATGTPVRLLDQAATDELTATADNPGYVGTLRGSDVLLPWTLDDFDPDRGGRHTAICGATGSGKTAAATIMLATQLRFPRMGQIILDPQGQFASQHGMVLPLQQLAAACGRQVTVARLSSSLRMPVDVDMFIDLLRETKLLREVGIKATSADQQEAACDVIANLLRNSDMLNRFGVTGPWADAESAPLLLAVLEALWQAAKAGDIYSTDTAAQRVMRKIRKPTVDEAFEAGHDDAWLHDQPEGIIDQQGTGGATWRRVYTRFAAVHGLWSRWSPAGQARILSGTDPAALGAEFERVAVGRLLGRVLRPHNGRPAPWLILDLSADIVGVDMDGGNDADGVDDDVATDLADTRRLLDSPPIKARIIRRILEHLARIGQAEFREGDVLDCQVTIDEAWEFLVEPDRSTADSTRALSNLLADLVRVIRKYGVGFQFILQAPSNVRTDIWRQIAVVAAGHGLHDKDDARLLAARVPGEHMDLYRSLPSPEATTPKRYPFMVAGGGATGLSLGTSPVFVEMFTDPARWLACNSGWIAEARRMFPQHLPAGDPGGPLTAIPGAAVAGIDAETARHLSARAVVDGRANTAAAQAVAAAHGNGSALPPPAARRPVTLPATRGTP